MQAFQIARIHVPSSLVQSMCDTKYNHSHSQSQAQSPGCLPPFPGQELHPTAPNRRHIALSRGQARHKEAGTSDQECIHLVQQLLKKHPRPSTRHRCQKGRSCPLRRQKPARSAPGRPRTRRASSSPGWAAGSGIRCRGRRACRGRP